MALRRILVLLSSVFLAHIQKSTQLICNNESPTTVRTDQKRLDDTAAGAQSVRYNGVASAPDCLAKCRGYQDFNCEGFNYKDNGNICEILDKDSDASLLADAEQWSYYDVICPGTTDPPTESPSTVSTTKEPNSEDDSNKIIDFFNDYPEYVAMIGMGILIILLFITSLVVLCFYTSRRAEEKYEEYPKD